MWQRKQGNMAQSSTTGTNPTQITSLSLLTSPQRLTVSPNSKAMSISGTPFHTPDDGPYLQIKLPALESRNSSCSRNASSISSGKQTMMDMLLESELSSPSIAKVSRNSSSSVFQNIPPVLLPMAKSCSAPLMPFGMSDTNSIAPPLAVAKAVTEAKRSSQVHFEAVDVSYVEFERKRKAFPDHDFCFEGFQSISSTHPICARPATVIQRRNSGLQYWKYRCSKCTASSEEAKRWLTVDEYLDLYFTHPDQDYCSYSPSYGDLETYVCGQEAELGRDDMGNLIWEYRCFECRDKQGKGAQLLLEYLFYHCYSQFRKKHGKGDTPQRYLVLERNASLTELLGEEWLLSTGDDFRHALIRNPGTDKLEIFGYFSSAVDGGTRIERSMLENIEPISNPLDVITTDILTIPEPDILEKTLERRQRAGYKHTPRFVKLTELAI